MQLTFKEVNPVYQEDYEDLFDAGIKGVGYWCLILENYQIYYIHPI
jgi:hypothetical protein